MWRTTGTSTTVFRCRGRHCSGGGRAGGRLARRGLGGARGAARGGVTRRGKGRRVASRRDPHVAWRGGTLGAAWRTLCPAAAAVRRSRIFRRLCRVRTPRQFLRDLTRPKAPPADERPAEFFPQVFLTPRALRDIAVLERKRGRP